MQTARSTTEARAQQALDHFLTLANRGSKPGASGGEKRAHRLAMAIATDCHGLDDLAIDGLMIFIAAAITDMEEARQQSCFYVK